MERISKLYENTWAVDDDGVRIFLLTGNEKALVIDTGLNALPVKEIVREVTDLPVILVNTHADPDHVSGNAAFDEFYMHPSEAFVYRNIRHGSGKILPVFDKDVIELGGRSVEVIHLPGHTPGSITLLDRQERCLIGGDPIQTDGDIYMFGLHRDLDAYIAGLENLLKRSEEFDYIYPSHAKLRIGKETIGRLIEGAKRILAGEVQGTEKEMNGTRILSVDAGVSRFLVDRIGREQTV